MARTSNKKVTNDLSTIRSSESWVRPSGRSGHTAILCVVRNRQRLEVVVHTTVLTKLR